VFRLALHTGIITTHLMYIPIAFACMWWGRWGIAVAAGLAAFVLSLHVFAAPAEPLWADAARGALFVVAALFIWRLRAGLVDGREALARSEAAARAFVEHSPQGVLVFRGERVMFANSRLCQLLGWDAASIMDLPLASLASPEDVPSLLALPDTPDLPRELPLRRHDGSSVWAEVAGARVEYHGRSAVLLSVTDVSGRREAEAKRRELAELARRQEEQLEHSTRLAELGEMAAAISHELNQPLTGIRNYARNAFYMIEKRAGGDEEVKGNLRLISEQVDRAAKIINQMRELTRRSDSVFTLLELNSVIRESIEFLLPQMRLSEVVVSLQLADDLPTIWGDRIRLAQVFLNLLSNARQAMEGSAARTLSITSRRDTAGPLAVVVEVSDTGKGFSEEQGKRLFQPFFTTRKGGHGLGLSISRAIIQDHKGAIEARGAPGAGATFIIRLPAAQRETDPARRDS
jgi:PAS domain S-box-containing protein